VAVELTDTGHEVLATALYNLETYHLAWGTLPIDYPEIWVGDPLPDPLTRVVEETVTRGDGLTDALAHTPTEVLSVVKGVTTYVVTTDYLVTGSTINWAPAGAQPNEDEEYVVTYRYATPDANDLIEELGRKRLAKKAYVTPDPVGTILVDGELYTESEEPTRYLYLLFRFDSVIETDAVIYQVGVFINTTTSSGNSYLEPDDVTDPGKMLLIQNIVPVTRVEGKREYFQFVLRL
jgi:hypothetical protein